MQAITDRIEEEAGVPGLVGILAERLAPTDLQSLLLAVYHRRSSQRRPADVLSQYETDRFVRPAAVSPRRLLAWEQVAFADLPSQFEPLALSPVCPLGASAVVASVDQNWAVATARNTEVVSDSTNVLALECAVRRRGLLREHPKSPAPVHLAASHRLLRGQRYDSPLAKSHFACFALGSAGRDPGSLGFEVATLGLHIRFYLRALRTFLGSEVPLRLALTDWNAPVRPALVEEQLLAPLRSEFAAVECVVDDQRTGGRGYYRDLCFHIEARNRAGEMLELVDGGAVDWTQRLLGNAKERMVISGIGSERLCAEFGEDIKRSVGTKSAT
jgi:hypothetical protein